MNIRLGKDRRITIPREYCEQLGIVDGAFLTMNVENNKIIIKEGIEDTEDEFLHRNNFITKSNEIVSNLDQADKLYKQVYSTCGLVVKTKRKYVNNFCDRCKGQLEDATHKCLYLKEDNNIKAKSNNEVKERKIKNEKIEEKEEKEVVDKSIKQNDFKDIQKRMNTEIQPIKSTQVMQCNVCNQYFYKGFLLDDDFYCTECAVEDFKKFYTDYHKGGNK